LSKLRPHEEKQLEHDTAHGRIGQISSADRNGFVEMPDGVSLHFSAEVVEGNFDDLQPGDQVLVKIAEAEAVYGPQASWVKPLGPLSARD
jgi:cold shock CspA family protein